MDADENNLWEEIVSFVREIKQNRRKRLLVAEYLQ
jgi:hypothetical protein